MLLELKHNSQLAFDPSHLDIDCNKYRKCDWADFYEGEVDAIPPNAPLPRGKYVDLYMFIDNDHADNK